jgi:hypothetical protein
MDGDGLKEFYVMSVSIWLGGFFYYGFENDGDNSFHQVWVDSLPGAVWDAGSLQLMDFDGDGTAELLVATGPWLAIYKAFGDDNFGLAYLRRGLNYKVSAYDADLDGFGEVINALPIPQGYEIKEFTLGSYYKGDMNADCLINGLDVTYMVNYFKGLFGYPLPDDNYKADVNGNCQVNGVDVLYLVAYLKGGPLPIDRDCE